MSKIALTKSRYLNLLEAEERLKILEASGVDNWSSYGCSCEYTDSDECIFCTEKSLEEYFEEELPDV